MDDKLTKEDISALLILFRHGEIENVPAKKPLSDSEIKARRQKLEAIFDLNSLLEKNSEKLRAGKTLKIASYGPVKAKPESSLKKPVIDYYVSSEEDSEDEKESDQDEDTKTESTTIPMNRL